MLALKSATLILLGQLADDSCTLLDGNNLKVIKEGETILQRTRNPSDGLYDIPLYAPPTHPHPKTTITSNNYVPPRLHCLRPPTNCHDNNRHPTLLPPPSTTKVPELPNTKYHINHISPRLFNHYINMTKTQNEKAMVILRKQQNCADLEQFLHGCAEAPVPSTWCKAIDKGHFITWPGLTSQLVRKHLPPSIPTAKGHLKQERQGLQSRKKFPPPTSYFTNIHKKLQDLKKKTS